jgi:hypothetical protein
VAASDEPGLGQHPTRPARRRHRRQPPSSLIDLVARGRAGELTDNPTHILTLQATKTACVLAGRGTGDDAQALLDLLAADVARDENHHQPHDKEHV